MVPAILIRSATETPISEQVDYLTAFQENTGQHAIACKCGQKLIVMAEKACFYCEKCKTEQPVPDNVWISLPYCLKFYPLSKLHCKIGCKK